MHSQSEDLHKVLTRHSDVVGQQSEIEISVYDKREGSMEDIFLGHIRTSVQMNEQNPKLEQWMPLQPRAADSATVTGEILIKMEFSS